MMIRAVGAALQVRALALGRFLSRGVAETDEPIPLPWLADHPGEWYRTAQAPPTTGPLHPTSNPARAGQVVDSVRAACAHSLLEHAIGPMETQTRHENPQNVSEIFCGLQTRLVLC